MRKTPIINKGYISISIPYRTGTVPYRTVPVHYQYGTGTVFLTMVPYGTSTYRTGSSYTVVSKLSKQYSYSYLAHHKPPPALCDVASRLLQGRRRSRSLPSSTSESGAGSKQSLFDHLESSKMAKESASKAKATKAAKAVKTPVVKSHRKPRYSVVFHRPTTLKKDRR